MKIKNIMYRSLISVFIVLFFNNIYAQGDRIIKINEILVFNETNYVDDYGKHSDWIELFNPAYNVVDISKMYLTNDKNNPTKYRIPDAGKLTQIQPRSFVVFYADNEPTKGIFHVNFLLDSTGYLAVYDSDGRTLLDEIYYPMQKVDVTYGRFVDGGEEIGFLDVSTPNSSNVTIIKPTSSEVFGEMDPTGVGITLIAMTIVFSVLILMYFIFRGIGAVMQNKVKVRIKVPKLGKGNVLTEEQHDVIVTGEVNAAIALAIHLYSAQAHDFENTNMTIKKISRPYSPWSSKIYTLRNNPRKN